MTKPAFEWFGCLCHDLKRLPHLASSRLQNPGFNHQAQASLADLLNAAKALDRGLQDLLMHGPLEHYKTRNEGSRTRRRKLTVRLPEVSCLINPKVA